MLGTLGTTLVIQGSRGTPNGHIGVQVSIFIDFRMHLGSLLGPTLDTFFDFSIILATKVRVSFQVHVFGDPGMEMMPECRVCMCVNHNKNCGFCMISLFPLIQ